VRPAAEKAISENRESNQALAGLLSANFGLSFGRFCGEPRRSFNQDDGKPASDNSVQSYIARAFGDRLREVRAAMEALAASLVPGEPNRVGFRLYERFRPDVPEGAQGWGAMGALWVERIVRAVG
jgi:hypothetical protein